MQSKTRFTKCYTFLKINFLNSQKITKKHLSDLTITGVTSNYKMLPKKRKKCPFGNILRMNRP